MTKNNHPVIGSAAAHSGIPIIEAHHPHDGVFWYRTMSDLDAAVKAHLVHPPMHVGGLILVDDDEWPFMRAENAAKAFRGEPLTFDNARSLEASKRWDGNR